MIKDVGAVHHLAGCECRRLRLMPASCAIWAATLLVVSVVSAAPQSPRTPGATLKDRGAEVIVQSGRLSVHVHQTRLDEVLEAVAREAGLEIVLRGAFDAPLTETFANLPLDEGIRRLCRGHSIVMIYDGPPGGEPGSGLSKVSVTSSFADSRAANPTTQANRATQDAHDTARPALLPRPENLTVALRLGPADSRTKILDALVDEQGVDAVVQILGDAATRDPDLRIRRSAIQALGSMAGPGALEAIRAGLNDPNASVRSAATLALKQHQHRHLIYSPPE